ncbi:MAG: hypothetical protein VKJ04_02080 [Vampirovibrionales bacterium]|nr:hypothetical protein [Vampirovibrionales bacterium]
MGTILYSNLSQHLLNQASNISYLVRNTTRMGTVPDDRQADYSFRDIYVTLSMIPLQEASMRVMDAMYAAPSFVRHLGLHNLGNEYYGVNGAKNYKFLPRPLETKMLGPLVSDKSFYNIGDLLKGYDIRRFQGQAIQSSGVGAFLQKIRNGLGLAHKPLTPDKIAELEVLAEQCERRLDPKGYAEYYYRLSQSQASILDDILKSASKEDLSHFATTAEGTTPPVSANTKKVLDAALEKNDGKLREAFGEKWRQKTFAHLSRGETWQKGIADLLHDGLTSRYVQEAVKTTRKSGGWMKLFGTILLNTVLSGIIGSWVDVNVVQPWQDKLVEKRGTSKEVVTPQIWSLIPAMAVGLLVAKLVKPLNGYGLRFSLAILSGVITYGVSTGLMLKNRLSKPPKGKYAHYAAEGFHIQTERKAKEAEKRRLGIPVPGDKERLEKLRLDRLKQEKAAHSNHHLAHVKNPFDALDIMPVRNPKTGAIANL